MVLTKEDWSLIKRLLGMGEWITDLDFSDEELRAIAMWLYHLWSNDYPELEKHLYIIDL